MKSILRRHNAMDKLVYEDTNYEIKWRWNGHIFVCGEIYFFLYVVSCIFHQSCQFQHNSVDTIFDYN